MKSHISPEEVERQFIRALLNIEGLEFIGVATLFGVPITNNGKDTLPVETILQGIMEKFRSFPEKRQKEMLVLVRQASRGQKLYPLKSKKKKGESINGNPTKTN